MNRRTFIVTAVGLLAAPLVVEGERAGMVYRLGILTPAGRPLRFPGLLSIFP
jgi:hypothetical protein